MQVRRVCEIATNTVGITGFKDKHKIIQLAIPKIFCFEYPIFDETYKNVLETKILSHYYQRDIAGETIGQWLHYLDITLNEVMPYYNQLYESSLLDFNPLYDTDITTTHTLKNDDKVGTEKTDTSDSVMNQGTLSDTVSVTNNNAENDNWNLYLDTPQGELDNLFSMGYNKNQGKYLDDARHEFGSESQNNKANATATVSVDSTQNIQSNSMESVKFDKLQTYEEHVKGLRGSSQAKLLKEFRATFLNIDKMVLDELYDCFYGLW